MRGAAALALAGTMTLSAIAGNQSAIAQTDDAGTAAAAISPADSILYVGFDLDVESPQWTLANELLTRAGAEETGADIIGSLSEDATGTQIDDVAAFVGGEAAFVVTSLEGVSEEAGGLTSMVSGAALPSLGIGDSSEDSTTTGGGWAFVLQPSDIDSAAQQLEAEAAATDSVQFTDTDYNGTTIRSAPADEMTGDSAVAYAVVGDFIVLGEVPSDVEPFIDAAAGTEDNLGDDAQFSQASDALAGDRLAFGFIDSTVIGDQLGSLDTSGMDLTGAFMGFEAAAAYTGMSIVADPAGFRFETVEIPAEGAPADAPVATSGASTFAENVPAGTLAMATGYELGQSALLQGIGMLFVTALNQGLSGSSGDESATPTPIPAVDELYGQAAQLLGFNLKTDFIDQMVGEYGFAIWGSNFDDPSQVGAILTSGVDQPATLSDTLSKLSFLIQAGAQGQANVTTRAVGDYNVNTVTVPQEGADPVVVEYGIVDGQFVLGVGDGVNAYLDTTDDSLAASEDYQTAMAQLPAEFSGVFYLSVPMAMEIEAASSTAAAVSIEDDPALCGEYTTQAAAQEAYDADPVENFGMDMDFNGVACETYFAAATPVASPVPTETYPAIRAFAGVSYQEDGLNRTSSILVIEN